MDFMPSSHEGEIAQSSKVLSGMLDPSLILQTFFILSASTVKACFIQQAYFISDVCIFRSCC